MSEFPKTRIRLRRGTAAQWSAADPVLASGEPGFIVDSNTLKIGDGTTAFASLSSISGGGGGGDVLDDTTPQLGGNLDINSRNIIGTGNVALTGSGTFTSIIKTGGTSSQFLKADGSVDSSTYLTSALSNVVEDTTPQLGGDLVINNNDITGTGNIDLSGDITCTEFYGPLDGSVRFTAKNTQSGTNPTIKAGQVVYIDGLSGNTPEIKLAKANSSTTMPAFGIAVTNSNLNDQLQIATMGTERGLDVANFGETGITFTLRNTLYVSASEAGHVTNIAPTGESNFIQNIGAIQRISPTTNASIRVGGAGRTNATPALNDGNIFIGNASNQSSSVSLNSKLDEYVVNSGLVYSNPAGITGASGVANLVYISSGDYAALSSYDSSTIYFIR